MPLRLLANRSQAREGKQAMSGIQWPGRQEWTERRRDPNGLTISKSAIGSPTTRRKLRSTIQWPQSRISGVALGRQMIGKRYQFRYRLADVNRAFKAMRVGEIPGAPLECRCGVPPALLAAFDHRRKAALEAAVRATDAPDNCGQQRTARRRASRPHCVSSNSASGTQMSVTDRHFPGRPGIRRAHDGRYLAPGVCIAIILLSASAHASAIRAFGEVEPGGVAKPLSLM
jgi:hypothetical protein